VFTSKHSIQDTMIIIVTIIMIINIIIILKGYYYFLVDVDTNNLSVFCLNVFFVMFLLLIFFSFNPAF